jgi:hypothetical protein
MYCARDVGALACTSGRGRCAAPAAAARGAVLVLPARRSRRAPVALRARRPVRATLNADGVEVGTSDELTSAQKNLQARRTASPKAAESAAPLRLGTRAPPPVLTRRLRSHAPHQALRREVDRKEARARAGMRTRARRAPRHA